MAVQCLEEFARFRPGIQRRLQIRWYGGVFRSVVRPIPAPVGLCLFHLGEAGGSDQAERDQFRHPVAIAFRPNTGSAPGGEPLPVEMLVDPPYLAVDPTEPQG